MGKIVLMEAHPLLRLGLLQILNRLGGVWKIVELDFSDLPKPEPDAIAVDLLIYGIPIGADSEWTPLAEAQRVLTPKRILLLTDVLPLPSSLQGLPEVPVYGCVMKTVSVEILEAAIRLVMAGGQCFPDKQQVQTVPASFCLPAVAALPPSPTLSLTPSLPMHPHDMGLAPDADSGNSIGMIKGAQLLDLTPRQYEVLVLLARGHPIKTISRMLNISVATAKTHACTLYQRLHVRNKGEAVYTARQRGATLEWHDSERESSLVSMQE